MARDKKYHRTVYQSLALISQFGITMLVPIFLCAFIGWFLDEKLQTSYLFILFFFIGALAGFRNIYILSKKIYTDSEDSGYEAVRRKLAEERKQSEQLAHSADSKVTSINKKEDEKGDSNEDA